MAETNSPKAPSAGRGLSSPSNTCNVHEADAIVESDRDVAHAVGSLVGELCENRLDQAFVLVGRFGPGRVAHDRGFAHHLFAFHRNRPDLVVACVVGQFGQAELLQAAEAGTSRIAPGSPSQSVPTADRVFRRAPPRLHGAVGSRLLLIGRTERNPTVLLRPARRGGLQLLVGGT